MSQQRDDRIKVVTLRIPLWLKRRVEMLAAREGVSMNTWLANVVNLAVEDSYGLPAAPPAHAPLPTVVDVIDSYFRGDEVIEPCGRSYPCERHEAGEYQVGEFIFCEYCRIRIR